MRLTKKMHPATRRAMALAAVLLVSFVACSGTKKPDKITQELLAKSKEELFEKGKGLIEKKKYEQGRKYLTFVFETYPNDPLGRDALLMVADSYFKQGGTGYTEARFRYRDYLNRYPAATRRDYARYQFALTYDKEIERPDRDQTATREAIDQYRALIREYPTSSFATAAKERVRVLTDNLAEHEFAVGYFYMRKGAPAAALVRFTELEQRYPEYGARDKLFFYAARALERLGRREEANRYYSRILEEFPESEWARRARGERGGKAAPAAAVAATPKS
ncbi:MAG TPA: outer membrane protein assembly factor BamD [Thermoanaerobaculia bacterium]|nr:outer membrane protein assembly factor BamD [Thermoanaerobaculia bacterium]